MTFAQQSSCNRLNRILKWCKLFIGGRAGQKDQQEVIVRDVDRLTTTDALNTDSDGGGRSDDREDDKHDGQVDSSELDPIDLSSKENMELSWISLLLRVWDVRN